MDSPYDFRFLALLNSLRGLCLHRAIRALNLVVLWPLAAGVVAQPVVAPLPTAATVADAPSTTATPTWTQWQIRTKTYNFDTGDTVTKMEYALFVPTSYRREVKTPLVVALHGLY